MNFADLLNLFVYRPDLNIGATIKALQDKNLLQILAEPNLITLEGKEASFLAGGSFPFPILTTTSTGGSTAPVITVQFKPFGVQLTFTPTVTSSGAIDLKVTPEVSSLDFANAVTLQGFTIPALSQRKADTEVVLREGESFAIAGLIDNRVIKEIAKVPYLGNIPMLGYFFKSTSTQKVDRRAAGGGDAALRQAAVAGRKGQAARFRGDVPAGYQPEVKGQAKGAAHGSSPRIRRRRSSWGREGIRNRTDHAARARQRFSLQLLVLLVPVFFGLMGFALDLGRLYLIRGELNQAASAMALSAATQLLGTVDLHRQCHHRGESAPGRYAPDTPRAITSAPTIIGQTTGLLSSTVNSPAFFATLADALGTSSGTSGNTADGTTARHVQITLTADAPLLFWSLLSAGQGAHHVHRRDRRRRASARRFAWPAASCRSPSSRWIRAIRRTTASSPAATTRSPTSALPAAANPAPHIAEREHRQLPADRSLTTPAMCWTTRRQQLYIGGANGLLAAPTSDVTAAGLPDVLRHHRQRGGDLGIDQRREFSASPGTCGSVPTRRCRICCAACIRAWTSRSLRPAAAPTAVTDAANLATTFLADTSPLPRAIHGGDYTAYTGNGRRIITVPIVDAFGTLTCSDSASSW